ncbi:MDR family MFS transporter [Corynebacterium breve]|uniref:MDR family MFS transporter n=1 Tax=Corynebacterium breve TaxID=3049799 RepID=A0ABY8VFL9_9CORY|nr:MDR family MFS transporter [Corynebacterium breve]WIM67433.1 MDR family MFS transporter [Corynebacterium breve]
MSSPEHSDQNSTAHAQMSGETIALIAVLVMTTFVMMLNETALAVALPNIMHEFNVAAATAQWLLTGVMLTMAIMMPLTGWILDRFSTRRVYFFAVVAFLLGSAVAALSPTFGIMLLGRVLQAMGTAVVIPLQMTVVMTVVPPKRRGTVMGVIAIVMAVGPALGPTFAGAVMAVTSWHIVFWVMAVLVIIPGLVGVWKLRNVGELKQSPLDVLSVVLSVFAFGGIVYGLGSVGIMLEGGPEATVAIAMSVLGVVGLVLFIWRQLALGSKGTALLNLQPLKIRNFVIALVVIVLYQGSMLGMYNTLPLFLQGALLTTALVAGLASLPGGIVETIFSPLAGALYDRIGPRPLVIPGTVICSASMWWMATVDHTTSVTTVAVMYAVFSVGLAMTLTPLMTTAMSSLSGDVYSHGSAILNTLLQLAGAAGTALMIANYELVSVAGGGSVEAQGRGGATTFMLCAVVLTVATVVTLFLQRPEEARETNIVEVTDPR